MTSKTLLALRTPSVPLKQIPGVHLLLHVGQIVAPAVCHDEGGALHEGSQVVGDLAAEEPVDGHVVELRPPIRVEDIYLEQWECDRGEGGLHQLGILVLMSMYFPPNGAAGESWTKASLHGWRG